MEQRKQHVLIVEGQEDWLGILRQSFAKDEFDTAIARNYDEAVYALGEHSYDLVIVDPVLDGPVHNPAIQGGHDGLQLLAKLAYEYPQIHVIVVSGSVGREMLRNARELPNTLPSIQKQGWDRDQFMTTVKQVMDGEAWGPPEPQIEMPADAVPQTGFLRANYAGLTGPLSPTGMTGPLSTGLVPPSVAASAGKPRVLIIDSDPQWQHKLALMMETEGYFWRVAPDYEQAMERLRLETFHVVLLDLRPDESGTALTEGKGWHLLEYVVAQAPKTKIIVGSGAASRSDVARLFMRYPIKGFIDKENFDQQEFLNSVREQFAGPRLKIQMLGDFRVWRDGKPINSFNDSNAERLIKILLTRRGENVSVEELTECLWPNADVKSTAASLGTTISNARTELEPDLPRPNDSHFILRNGANYTFNFMANVDVDAEHMRRMVSEGRQHERRGEHTDAVQAYETARAIYQGDYLPAERFERWAIQERSALQGLFTDALNRIADLYADMDQFDRAIEAATRSLQANAYIESTYRRLMRYHTCKGDKPAALNVYRALVKLFSEFFGEDPDPLTQRLHDDIEAGRTVECVEASSISGEWRLANE